MFYFSEWNSSLFSPYLKRDLYTLFALTSSTTHWRLLALIANILLFLMCTYICLSSQSDYYDFDSLTIGCLFLMWKVVFIVMLFLWSFLVALLYRGVVFYSTLHRYLCWNRAAVGVFVPPHPPTLFFSLYLGHSVGVAAFNVCVKQSLNLDIKLVFKKIRKNDQIVTSNCLLL